jgi:hypothetical protein
MLPRAAPRPRAGACTLESSLRCLRTSDHRVLRGVFEFKKIDLPRRCWTGASRAGICLPRDAHAALGCPEAPSRRLHPGVLPPLPAHLGSSSSPGGVGNSRKSTSPRRCWTGASRAGICFTRGAHAAPGCPEAPSRRLHPGVLPPLPAHLGSSTSPVGCWKFEKIDLPPTMLDRRFKSRHLLTQRRACCPGLPRGPEQAPAPWSPPSAACAPRIIEFSGGCWKFEKIDLPPTMLDRRFKSRHLLTQRRACCPGLPRGPEQAPAPWSPPSAACAPRIIEFSGGCWKFEKIDLPPTMLDRRFKSRHLLTQRRACCPGLPRGPEQAPAPWSPPSAACAPRIIEFSGGCWKFEKIDLLPTMLDRRFKSRHLLTQRRACCPGLPRGPEQAPAPWSPPSAACAPPIIRMSGGCWKFEKIDLPPTMLHQRFKSRHLLTQRRACCPGLPRGPEQAPAPWSPPSAACAPRIIEFSGEFWKFEKIDLPPTMLDRRFKSRHLLTQRRACCPGLPRGPEQAPAPWSPPSAACAPRIIEFSGGCWKFEKIDLPPTMLDRRFKSRHLLTQRRACCPGLPRGPEQAPAPWSPPSAACAPRIIEFSGGCWKFEKIDLPPTMLDRRFKSRHLLTQRRACCPGLPRGPEQAPAPWSPPSAACAPRIIEFSGGCWKFEKIDLLPTMLDRRFKSRHLLTQRRACCPGLPRGPEQAPAPWSPPSAACAPPIIRMSGGCWKFEKIDLPPTMLHQRFKSRHLLTQRRACCPGLPRGPEQAPAPWSPPSAACAPRIIEFSGEFWKFEKIDLPPTMLDRRFKSRHLLTQRRACCPGLPRGPEQAPAPWSPPSAACAPRIIEFSGGCWKFEKIDLPPTMLDRRFKSRHLLTQRRACCPGLPRGPEQAPAPWSPPSAACAPRIIEFSGGCWKFEKIDLLPTMLDRRFKSRHLLTQRRACCPGLPRGPEQAPAPWSPPSAACAPPIIRMSGGCWKFEKIDLPPTMLHQRFKSRHLLTQRRACCPGLPRGPEQAPAPWSPPSAACAPRIIEFSGEFWKFEKIDLPPTMLDRRFKSRHLLTQRRACCPGLPRGPEQAPAPWSPPSAACAPRIIEFSGGCWKFEKIDIPPTMLDRRFKSRHLLTQRRACCPGLPRGPEQAPAPWSPPSAACAPRIIEFSGGCWKFEKIDLPPTMLDRRFKSRHLLTQRRACCPGLPRGPEQAPAPWSPPSAACAPRIIEFSGGCWKFEKIDLLPTMLDRRFKSRHLLTQRRACCPGLPRGPEQAPAPWSPPSAACAPPIIRMSGGCWKFEKIDLPPTMLHQRFKSRHLLTQRRACCPGLPRGPEQAPAPWSPPSAACAPRIIEFSGEFWKFEKIDLPPTMLDRRFKSRHLLTQRRACCPGLPRGPEQAPAPWSPPSAACAPRIIEFSGGCWKFEKIDLPPTMLDRRFKSRHLLTQRRACCPGLPRGPEQAPAPWSPPSAACAPRIIEFSGGCWKFEKIDLSPTMLDRRFKSRHLLTQRRACCPGLPRGPEHAPAPWSPPSAACAPPIIRMSGGCWKFEKIDLPPTMLDRRFKSRHLLTQRRACCPGLPRGPEQAPAPWSPPSAACAPRIIEFSGGCLNSRKSTFPRRCWTGASRAGICLPRDAHAALGCPEAPSRRLHPGVLPPLPAHLGSSSSPGGVGNSRKSTSPRRCWTGASRAGICLPRGAHAAPGCPEAPSTRLHPGVLPPLPAHLRSYGCPGGVGNSRKSTFPRRCWTGASRAGICLPRGAHAAPGCPEAPSRRLHPGVLPPLPAHLGSSSSPGGV